MNRTLIILANLSLITACTGDNDRSSSDTANSTYAYIADFSGNALLKCLVSTTDGTLNNCTNIAESMTLNNPTGVAIKNDQIFVNNSAFAVSNIPSSYTQCNLNNSDAPMSDCSVNTPTGLQNPIGITFNTDYAYFGNYFSDADFNTPGTYTICSIESATNSLINCSTNQIDNIPESGTPEVIVFNNNHAYITDQVSDGYVFCDVSTESGGFGSCQPENIESGSGGVEAIGPRGMMIHNNYAYIVNSGFHGGDAVVGAQSSYSVCRVNSITSALENCSTQQTSPGLLNSPTGIAVNNGLVYITSENGPGYVYTMCTIADDGFLNNCNTITLDGAITQSGPWLTYIAFGN